MKLLKLLFYKVTSIVLIMATILSLSCIPLASGKQTVAQLENEYDRMEDKLSAIKSQISSLKNDASKQKEYKEQLQQQINIIETQITNIQDQIDALNSQIKTANKNLTANAEKLSKNEADTKSLTDNFLARLRAMYMTSAGSTLSVILGADSFSEMLQKAEFASRIAENDRRLLEEYSKAHKVIEDIQVEIRAEKDKLEETKKSVNQKKKTLESKKKDLDSQKKEINSVINSIEKEQASLQAEKIAIEEEMEEISNQIEKLIKDNETTDEYVGGEFLWPVAGYNSISSYYGWRTLYGRKNYHTGMDIAGRNSSGEGINGKPIRAANSGKVMSVTTSYTRGKGYGKYLIIDHGGSKSTLYAHCSSIAVRKGDKVTKGQTVAYVGSTGNSTGPHLHFEIRINGKHTNPLSYFK